MPTTQQFPMCDDVVIGDGGNVTIYERPDSSRYTLDKRGKGCECEPEALVFGKARFDARELSTGVWKGSRSAPQAIAPPPEPMIRAVRGARR